MCIFVVLTLKSRMSLPEDIVLIAIERKNKLLSTKATVFRNEDSQGRSTMEKNYATTFVKHLNIALRTRNFSSTIGYSDIFLSWWIQDGLWVISLEIIVNYNLKQLCTFLTLLLKYSNVIKKYHFVDIFGHSNRGYCEFFAQ